jgi:hypothetical protein
LLRTTRRLKGYETNRQKSRNARGIAQPRRGIADTKLGNGPKDYADPYSGEVVLGKKGLALHIEGFRAGMWSPYRSSLRSRHT